MKTRAKQGSSQGGQNSFTYGHVTPSTVIQEGSKLRGQPFLSRGLATARCHPCRERGPAQRLHTAHDAKHRNGGASGPGQEGPKRIGHSLGQGEGTLQSVWLGVGA